MVKLTSFNYTDAKGKESTRVCLFTSSPSDKFAGIDVTGLEEVDQFEFANEYSILKEEFLAEVEELKESFDLKHNFRQFFEAKMRDVTYDEL